MLNSVGASNLLSVTEASYSGTFTLSSTNCANIATFESTPGAGPFTVIASGAGTCQITASDTQGNSASVSVIVTITNIGGH
jgi:hypothetical protein